MTRTEIENSIKTKNTKIDKLSRKRSELEIIAGQLVFSNNESDITSMAQVGEVIKLLFLKVGAQIPHTGYNDYLMSLKKTISSAISQIDESVSFLRMQVINLNTQLILTPKEEV